MSLYFGVVGLKFESASAVKVKVKVKRKVRQSHYRPE
jgi:copper(I)-binding protein